MPQVIGIEEILASSEARYAVAWLDEPLVAYGKLVLVGLWPIMTLDMSPLLADSFADMGDRPYIGLNLTRAKASLADLFAEEVRPLPLKRPSGKTGPTSLRAMVPIQTRAMLNRDPYPDDDREWYDTYRQIIRSMVPDRAKIWLAEEDLVYEGNLGNHRIPQEDEEALFEIAGLEPNQWTGTFVDDLVPLKSKWKRW